MPNTGRQNTVYNNTGYKKRPVQLLKLYPMIIVIISIFISSANGDNKLFTITPDLNFTSLGKKIEILKDPGGDLTIDDVAGSGYNKKFFASPMEEPGYGFSSSVYWIRLNISNPSDKIVNWNLEIGYPLLDKIDIYKPVSGGGFIVSRTGDHLPFSSREVFYRNFCFQLSEEPNTVNTYYLRFQTGGSMNFPLYFWSRDFFYTGNSTETIILGIFFGAIFIMAVYNIFLFIGFLDRSYIYIVLFLITWGLTQLSLNGLSFQYLWPDWVWWANVNIPFFIFLSMFSADQLARSLLNTRKNLAAWDLFLNRKSLIFLFLSVLSLMVPYAVSIRLAAVSAIVTVIVLVVIAVKCIRAGIRSAYFFAGAWGLFFLGVLLFVLKSFGILPGNFIANWGIQIGAFTLIVLFSIAVQDRIQIERKEKFKAQREALENEQKLVKNLKKTEIFLEEKVKERTRKLSEKNTALKKKTRELRELARELDTLDNIVRIIGREFEFSKVINVLLEQGVKLFPQAQQGAALIFNPETGFFHFAAALGYDLKIFNKKLMTITDIRSAFADLAEEVIKGVYIIRRTKNSVSEFVFDITKSKSILAMSIGLEGELAGFLIFDNNNSRTAFDHSDAHKLSRFRSHAISAFAKATLLQEMGKMTAEFIKTKDQLFVQEKLASLGQLTAGIAHEIKNPLNFVTNFAEGSLELSEELIEIVEKLREYLDKDNYDEISDVVGELKQNAKDILENGKRADKIVKSMMDHARGDEGIKKATDINSLVEESINLAYHGYRAVDPSFSVEFQKMFDYTLKPVEVVQQDIGRVILNILNNAYYAVVEKQKAAVDNYSPVISISTRAGEGEIEIRICDNGPGIPEKIREKIFTPFYTTKPTGGGNTGLGLSISYDIIVQQHHGRLEVNSKPGDYTEFIISLPNPGGR